MYEKCDIHLLPSNETPEYRVGYYKECLSLEVYKHPNAKNQLVLFTSTAGISIPNPYHLYITDNSKIDVDNWVVLPNGTIHKMTHRDMISYLDSLSVATKKIISTTNSSLINDIPNGTFSGKHILHTNLPKIPKRFVEHYINEYNASREVKKVLVEYTECSLPEGACADCKIKVNCDDVNNPFVKIFISPTNEISIKPVEEKMYSRDEVKEIAESAYHFGRLNSTISMPKFDNWIKDNLK